MNDSAFLIIDMQKGAVRMTEPSFYEIDTVVRKLKEVLKEVRARKIPVIYAQHYNPAGYPAYGSADWQIIDELRPLEGELIIHKTSPDIFIYWPG
jgi:nicotinamidase-related amidase